MSQPTPSPYDPNGAPQQPYSQPAPQPAYQQPAYQQPAYQQPAYGQGYADQGYAQAGPANNTMALVSLISGIVGWTLLPFVASIVAVITGHIAKKQIAATGEGGSGMATAGLILGYVMIGLSILGGIAFILFFAAIASTSTTGY